MSLNGKILMYLYEHAGSDQHEIARACEVSPYDTLFMGAIGILHDFEMIRKEPAYYPTQWYLTDRGEEVVKTHLTNPW